MGGLADRKYQENVAAGQIGKTRSGNKPIKGGAISDQAQKNLERIERGEIYKQPAKGKKAK